MRLVCGAQTLWVVRSDHAVAAALRLNANVQYISGSGIGESQKEGCRGRCKDIKSQGLQRAAERSPVSQR